MNFGEQNSGNIIEIREWWECCVKVRMWGWRWRWRICCCQVEWCCWGRMWRCCPSKLEWDWKPQCLPHLLPPLYKSVHLQIVPTQSALAMLSTLTAPTRCRQSWAADLQFQPAAANWSSVMTGCTHIVLSQALVNSNHTLVNLVCHGPETQKTVLISPFTTHTFR